MTNFLISEGIMQGKFLAMVFNLHVSKDDLNVQYFITAKITPNSGSLTRNVRRESTEAQPSRII